MSKKGEDAGFGFANTKREGDIADPDEFTWECSCSGCEIKYQKWKAAFAAQQEKKFEKWRIE